MSPLNFRKNSPDGAKGSIRNPFKTEFLPLSTSSTTSRKLLSQFSMDEDDLKWVANEKNIFDIIKTVP